MFNEHEEILFTFSFSWWEALYSAAESTEAEDGSHMVSASGSQNHVLKAIADVVHRVDRSGVANADVSVALVVYAVLSYNVSEVLACRGERREKLWRRESNKWVRVSK